MNRKIGVVDSGLGGLLVLETLQKVYPHAHYIYIGDQEHAPYGDCAKEELLHYGLRMMQYLYQRQVQEVVIACNTLCANVLHELRNAYPQMKIHDIIETTCCQLKQTKKKKILVLATYATVQKHAYQKELKKICDAEIIELACPKLVPMIEENRPQEQLQKVLQEYLQPYIGNIDAIILGCTHYPILKNYIKTMIDVDIFDSNEAIAHQFSFDKSSKEKQLEIYTTKDAMYMHDQIKKILKKDYPVSKLRLD